MTKKYLWMILLLLLISGAGWYFSGLDSHSEATITSPKPGETVGPNFPITVAAPDTWFQNGVTTVTVAKSDGSILMTGGGYSRKDQHDRKRVSKFQSDDKPYGSRR
jgi:hypothetical protein